MAARVRLHGRKYFSEMRRVFKSGWRMVAWVALGAAAALASAHPAPAQGLFGFRHHDENRPETKPEEKVVSSQPPAFAIPADPLGFARPGSYFEGQRDALVSLDFLDENTLLFTFRSPGLMRRDNRGGEQRQIRAVVLSLPRGVVQAEALWTLHDDDRYLWRLKGGRFLLRDLNNLSIGDASLQMTPFLEFPGPVKWLGMDPGQKYLVTDSHEPPPTKPKAGQVQSPAEAAASVITDSAGGEADQAGGQDIVLRILRRTSGQVMLVSHVRNAVRVPISSEGYMESLRGMGRKWVLNLDYFSGGSRIVGDVESNCRPITDFLRDDEVLVTVCTADGGLGLVAMSIDGDLLWNAPLTPTQVWPKLVVSPNGLRVARESLTVTHPVSAFSPLSFEDVKGQRVEVFDAATGKLVLTASASPILDGGGNVAISPSGRRVAVLDAGAIQVYELPTPPEFVHAKKP